MNKEKARLNNLVDKSVQEEPVVISMAIQTEFLVPPMELRTVMAKQLAAEGAKHYPQVMSHVIDHLHAHSRQPSARDGHHHPNPELDFNLLNHIRINNGGHAAGHEFHANQNVVAGIAGTSRMGSRLNSPVGGRPDHLPVMSVAVTQMPPILSGFTNPADAIMYGSALHNMQPVPVNPAMLAHNIYQYEIGRAHV